MLTAPKVESITTSLIVERTSSTPSDIVEFIDLNGTIPRMLIDAKGVESDVGSDVRWDPQYFKPVVK